VSDSTEFFFDDFFVGSDDPGVEIKPVLRGRVVPMRITRGLSLDDREAAKAMAVRQHLNPQGQMVLDGIDEKVLNVEVLARALKSWPFTRDGQPVPITRQTITALGGDCCDAIMAEMAKLLSAAEDAHAPFENPSDAAS